MARKPQSDAELVNKALSCASGYAAVKLGINLHPIQAKVLDSLFTKSKSKVILRAGNGTGKTSSVITTAILYALEMKNAICVSTSATYRQITGQLIPNLKRYSSLFPEWEFLENAIVVNKIKKYVGFSTTDQGTFQGWHAKPDQPLLMIVDEGAAVSDEIYKAIDRCQPTWLLIAGSPLSPEGTFYDLETKPEMYKQFHHFKLGQLDCLKEHGYWIDRKEIDILVEKWGKDHALVLSSVYADFDVDIENALLSLKHLQYCYDNPPLVNEFENGKCVSIDWAAGGDENIIAFRKGNTIRFVKCWRNKDTMKAVEEAVVELDRLKEKEGLKPNEVYADSGGLGKPMTDRLKDFGWNVNYFYGQSAPYDENYRYRIDELWIEGSKKIQKCQIIIPKDEELRMQLLSRKQRLNRTGKMEIESKIDMKDRNIPSPDRADALFMCLSEGNSSLSQYAKPMDIKNRVSTNKQMYSLFN